MCKEEGGEEKVDGVGEDTDRAADGETDDAGTDSGVMGEVVNDGSEDTFVYMADDEHGETD